ncbi:MAG: ABC transporter ATP-binding protein [Myxococcota bacterium]
MSAPKSNIAGLSIRAFHEEDELSKSYDSALLARLWPFMAPHLNLLVPALLIMPLTAGVALLQPYLLKLAIDAVLVEESLERLLQIVFYFGLVLFGEFVGRFVQVFMMQLAGQRTMASLRRHVFRHIQTLPTSYFDRTPVGRLVTRVTNDVDSLSEFFASGAVTAVADILTLLGIVGFMLYLDWELSLVAFLAIPPLLVLVSVFRRFARRAFRDIRARISQLNAFLAEQVNGIATVQAYGREDRCAEEYREINAGYRDANYRAIRFDALLYSVVESVSVASVAIILWYASTRSELADPETSVAYVGTVVAFYSYIQRFFVPIRELSTKYTIIQSSLASAERIVGLLDVEGRDGEVEPGGPTGDDDSPAVAFKDVTFAYREGYPVLRNIDLEIGKGETIAIVGATGSGKTTLTSLLLRLYDHQEGAIEIGGRSIRSMPVTDLRRRFAVVPQDVFLFGGTIADNVSLGSERDDERVREALDRLGVLDYFEERDGGIDAPVDERGANFSAGERQLIAFARALYREADVLILDEATANIDSETEAKLQAAVETLVEGRTALVIAHRLSTIRNADRIVVFHRGEIAEQGSHESLLAQNGVYARLHRLHQSVFGEDAENPAV